MYTYFTIYFRVERTRYTVIQWYKGKRHFVNPETRAVARGRSLRAMTLVDGPKMNIVRILIE